MSTLEVNSPETGKTVFGVEDRTGHVTSRGPVPAVSKTYTGWTKVSNTGTDTVGTVTLRAGTTPVSGAVCDVAFHAPYERAPVVYVAGPNGAYASDVTIDGFTVNASSTPVAGASQTFNYLVVSN